MWEQSLDAGFGLLGLAIDTNIVTSHFALPLLIRNPGEPVTHFAAVEEVTDAELRDQLETNLFGTHRVVRAALPGAQDHQSEPACVCDLHNA